MEKSPAGSNSHSCNHTERIAAHRITFEGRDYFMSVAEVTADGNVVISPLSAEIPFTTFINGQINLRLTPDGLQIVK